MAWVVGFLPPAWEVWMEFLSTGICLALARLLCIWGLNHWMACLHWCQSACLCNSPSCLSPFQIHKPSWIQITSVKRLNVFMYDDAGAFGQVSVTCNRGWSVLWHGPYKMVRILENVVYRCHICHMWSCEHTAKSSRKPGFLWGVPRSPHSPWEGHCAVQLWLQAPTWSVGAHIICGGNKLHEVPVVSSDHLAGN